MKQFRSPQTIIARFTARRTLRSAVFWAFIFSAYVASKSTAYSKAAPTVAERAKLAASFSSNIGLNALLGLPHHLETVAGFAAWNTLSIVTIIGAIWAFLLATRYFRGEEESGRRELLLAGQTTALRAAMNTLVGLGASLLALFAVVAVLFVAIGRINTVNFTTSGSLFFALSSTVGAAEFLAIGALTSQLMPTRSHAASLAGVIFGISFLIRAMADVTMLRWLQIITPLGWIERLEPLTGSNAVWLWPILGLIVGCCAGTIWLAGRHDMGASTFADHDSAKPKYGLLNNVFGATLRLTRGATLGWLAAITFAGIFYGALTKSAAQALSNALQSSGADKVLSGLTRSSERIGSILFLSIVFFLLTLLVMVFVASASGKIRDDEAQGYLDNFLVRPVSRNRWLIERILLVGGISLLACLITTLGVWTGQASQHAGVAFHSLLTAGVNMFAPVLFATGAAVFTFGVRPRITSLVAYSVVGWSFMIAILSSGVHLNHWLLDTSVLQHVRAAPAVNPNWSSAAIIIILGMALAGIGVIAFNRRDIMNE